MADYPKCDSQSQEKENCTMGFGPYIIPGKKGTYKCLTERVCRVIFNTCYTLNFNVILKEKTASVVTLDFGTDYIGLENAKNDYSIWTITQCYNPQTKKIYFYILIIEINSCMIVIARCLYYLWMNLFLKIEIKDLQIQR